MTTTPKPIAFPELLKQATKGQAKLSGAPLGDNAAWLKSVRDRSTAREELNRRALEFFCAGGYEWLKKEHGERVKIIAATEDDDPGTYINEISSLLRILDGETINK